MILNYSMNGWSPRHIMKSEELISYRDDGRPVDGILVPIFIKLKNANKILIF